jgi:hypothetical protein
LGQIIDGSLTDEKLSNDAGQIKCRVGNFNGFTHDNLTDEVNAKLNNSIKSQPNGVASLDNNAQVPTNQLDNVQYLKDFYGRSVNRFSTPLTFYDRVRNSIPLDLKDYLPFATDTRDDSDDYGKVDVWDFVLAFVQGSTSSHRVWTPPAYANLLASCNDDEDDAILTYASSKKYDLTNVDSIDFDVKVYERNTSSPITYIKFGVSTSQTSHSSYNALYTATNKLNRQIITINVKNLTGEYYLKMSSYMSPKYINAGSSEGYMEGGLMSRKRRS